MSERSPTPHPPFSDERENRRAARRRNGEWVPPGTDPAAALQDAQPPRSASDGREAAVGEEVPSRGYWRFEPEQPLPIGGGNRDSWNMRPDPRLLSRYLLLAKVAAAVVVLIGGLVLVGWALDVSMLKRIVPGFVSMKANAALAFILGGVSVWLMQGTRLWSGRALLALVCAGLSAAIAGLTLAEYLFDWDLGIDQLLFVERETAVRTSNPGRMAPNSAFGILLCGTALVLLGLRRGISLAQVLASIAFFTGLLAVLGYLYDVAPLYGITPYTQMALHAALLLVLLSLAILLLSTEGGALAVLASDTPGGVLARRLLPAAILLPALIGWVRLLGERLGLYDVEFGVALITTANIILFSLLIWWTAYALHRASLERRRIEDTMRFLTEASITLAGSLDYEVTLARVARLVVPSLADWCAIEVLEDGVLQPVALVHTDPAKVDLGRELQERYPSRSDAPAGAPRVVRTGEAEVFSVIPEEVLAQIAHDEEHLHLLRTLGLRSALVVPLKARGRTLGAISLIAETAHRYTSSDLAPVEELARTCALAVDNARLYREAQREIEERRQAEAEVARLNRDLRQRVTELQTVLDVAPIGIGIAQDPECRVVTANPAFAEMLGMEPGRNSSKSAPDGDTLPFKVLREGCEVPPEELPIQQAAAHGVIIRDEEYEVVREDGRVVTLLEYAAPLHDEEGKVRGALGAFVDISELKEAEAALRSSIRELQLVYGLSTEVVRAEDLPEIYETALEAVLEGLGADRASLLLFDPDGVIRFKAWHGLSEAYRAAVEGHTPWRPDTVDPLPIIVQDAERDPTLGPYKTVILEEGIRALAFIPLTYEGRVMGKFMAYFDAPHLFSDEELQLAQTIANHVAFAIERKRTEEALRAGEERYRTLFDSIEEGFCVLEMMYDEAGEPVDYRFLETNPAFERHTGLIDPAGKTARELVPGLERHWFEIYGRVAATGRRERFEQKSGAMERWFEVEAFRVGAPERRRVAVLFTDITERKLAEEALRESEARFRTYADTAPALLWVTDPSGYCTFLSQAWYDYTGQSEEEGQGFGWTNAIHPDDREAARSAFIAANERQKPFRLDYRLRRHDGAYRWALDAGQPRRDADDTFLGYVGSILDVHDRREAEVKLRQLNETLEERVHARTAELEQANRQLQAEVIERTRAEEALERANEALVRSNRELQDFAYVASHDLQEPLRKIRTFSDLLRTDYEAQLDETAGSYLDRMEDAAERMSRLITDLLSFSRVATKAKPFEPVDLGSTVEGVLSDLEVRIMESNAEVEVGELPTIEADPMQMRQLFQNLLSNALKFHDEDAAPVVRVRAEVEGEFCRLEVEDNGIGFEERYLDRIFSPFQRLHGRSRYSGTGIGLAVCRRIAERHGGTITAHSIPGEGSTFVVMLPVRQAEKTAEEGGNGEEGVGKEEG